MSNAFAKSLAKRLDQLVIGPPLFAPRRELTNMVVYPLFPSQLHPDPPDMVTLSEAMRRGARLTDTGVVSRVRVDNPLPTSILAGESEVLIGPTQLRAVQFSCLIPPDRCTTIPVNCVEEGQPIRHQARFTHSDASPWAFRSYKMEQMAQHGEPPQYWLWDSIKSYLHAASTPSTTHDLHAIFDKNAHPLQHLNGLFPCQPGQVGAICAVGENFFLELFGDPEILEDRYEQLLRSALVEAIAHPDDRVLPAEMVAPFLAQLVQVSQQSKLMQSRGLKEGGRSLAFSNHHLSGSALVADGHLIHLSAHQRCLGFAQPFASQKPDLETSRESWTAEHPFFIQELEAEYADRRKRYRSFKERLKPISPSPGAVDAPPDETEKKKRPLETAAHPLPLSNYLHDFFLRLFREL